MDPDKRKPTGADTFLWWAELAVQWRKNMANEWAEMQCTMMDNFNAEYEKRKGMH